MHWKFKEGIKNVWINKGNHKNRVLGFTIYTQILHFCPTKIHYEVNNINTNQYIKSIVFEYRTKLEKLLAKTADVWILDFTRFN